MSRYLTHLTEDLPRWIGLGYVTQANADLILEDAKASQKESWFRLPMILSMLGGLLVFAGVISWVAGNWDDLPRLARLILLVGLMLGSLGLAHLFRQKQSEGLAQGFAFLAVLMFGADLMLIAQIYQLPANPPGGALLWTLGAAAVAVIWPSQLSMALAFVLAGIWSWFVASGRNGMVWDLLFALPHAMHWPYLLLWGALAAYSVKRNWGKAMHMAGLSLAFWCMHTLFSLFDENSVRLAGLALMVLIGGLTFSSHLLRVIRPGAGVVSKYLWVLFAFWLLVFSAPEMYRDIVRHLPETGFVAPQVFGIALVLGMAGTVWALRWYERLSYAVPVAVGLCIAALTGLMTFAGGDGVDRYRDAYFVSGGAGLRIFIMQVLLAILVMAASVGSIVHGYKSNEKFFINLGFTVFAIKLIWLYFDNEWGLANRAGFFILGGLLVVALGIVFDRQRRKLILKMQENQP